MAHASPFTQQTERQLTSPNAQLFSTAKRFTLLLGSNLRCAAWSPSGVTRLGSLHATQELKGTMCTSDCHRNKWHLSVAWCSDFDSQQQMLSDTCFGGTPEETMSSVRRRIATTDNEMPCAVLFGRAVDLRSEEGFFSPTWFLLMHVTELTKRLHFISRSWAKEKNKIHTTVTDQ